MAVVTGTIIDNADVIARFENNVRLLIQGAIVWHNAASMPSYYPTGELGTLVQAGPNEGQLSPTITANLITQTFASYTKGYTSVRYSQFIRTWTGYGVDYNQTQVTALIDTYDQPPIYPAIDAEAANANVIAGQLATAVNFNDYITRLYNDWIIARNNTVVFTATYCHSSCHGSCHGSRRHR